MRCDSNTFRKHIIHRLFMNIPISRPHYITWPWVEQGDHSKLQKANRTDEQQKLRGQQAPKPAHFTHGILKVYGVTRHTISQSQATPALGHWAGNKLFISEASVLGFIGSLAEGFLLLETNIIILWKSTMGQPHLTTVSYIFKLKNKQTKKHI